MGFDLLKCPQTTVYKHNPNDLFSLSNNPDQIIIQIGGVFLFILGDVLLFQLKETHLLIQVGHK